MFAHRLWFLVACAAVALTACQDNPTDPDGGTLEPQRIDGFPAGWAGTAGSGQYAIGLDHTNKRSGSAAAYLTALISTPTTFASITQTVRPESYRGQRVRWTGWVRPSSIVGEGGGLWMRVDGPGTTLAFDNMSPRRLVGSGDWREVSVVLDVPPSALGLSLGVLLSGAGDLLVDDLRLEGVGHDVPVTDMLTAPVTVNIDSATIAAVYARVRNAPINLDFEGLPPVPPPSAATIQWLTQAAASFAWVEPGDTDADLEPLRDMVGAARLVGMGEGTHGTREFFQLKHRVFQFLVRQMGFTHFAIEATWPEANDLNHYVLTGEGNPARLLSSLYFWTWNTQEVLDLIAWMRQWNLTAAPERRVQFLGFDMQYPGAAMDTVASFLGRVDPSGVPFVADRYSCLVPYRNRATVGPRAAEYAALPTPTRTACRTGLAEVHDRISQRRADYEPASSPHTYQNALQSARLVQQWEEMAGAGTAGGALRDRFMAENTEWLLNQAGAGARMMLWAHNYHVSRVPGAMGAALNATFGSEYVNLGFLFRQGRFNAVGVGSVSGLRPWQTQVVPNNSIEAIFAGTNQPRLLLDTRRIAAGGPAAAPVAGPLLMRSIGSGFDPAAENNFFVTQRFPADYDLLMYVAQTSESVLLPFVR